MLLYLVVILEFYTEMSIINMNSANDSLSGADIYAVKCMCDVFGFLKAPFHGE